MEIQMNFGQLEAMLASLHRIASDKRTQFQARLRNFQRNGIPADVATGRGKAVQYGAGHIVEMAVALEFTQLGLLPERIQEVHDANHYPIWQAIRMAAEGLLGAAIYFDPKQEHPDEPLSMFIYFDPTALAPLTAGYGAEEDQASATMFFAGAGIVRDNIVKWTTGEVGRISFVNVTTLLWVIGCALGNDVRSGFWSEVSAWAARKLEEGNAKERDSEIADAELRLNWARSEDDYNQALRQYASATRMPRFMENALKWPRESDNGDDQKA